MKILADAEVIVVGLLDFKQEQGKAETLERKGLF